MKTYAIISQKGGAGKTTLAINLAVAATLRNHTALIIDIDPQASAAQWGDHRKLDSPVVLSAQAARIESILITAKENSVDRVFIDTAPHSDNAALTAARFSDAILIPCRPSVLDLRAISQSVDIAFLAKKPAIVVINATPPRGSLSSDAMDVVKQYGITVCPVTVANRADFYHSLTEGKGVQEFDSSAKAAQEIESLYAWIESMFL